MRWVPRTHEAGDARNYVEIAVENQRRNSLAAEIASGPPPTGWLVWFPPRRGQKLPIKNKQVWQNSSQDWIVSLKRRVFGVGMALAGASLHGI